MYGTWCKAQFIPEKLMVKMGNNGCQQKAQIEVYRQSYEQNRNWYPLAKQANLALFSL